MQSFRGRIRLIIGHTSWDHLFHSYYGGLNTSKALVSADGVSVAKSIRFLSNLGTCYPPLSSSSTFGSKVELLASSNHIGRRSVSVLYRSPTLGLFQCTAMRPNFTSRCLSTMGTDDESDSLDSSASVSDVAPRVKSKRLSKTAKHIMQILDREAVAEMHAKREIPYIKPGYIIELKVEIPENKRRISTVQGIVIARRNSGVGTTIRVRRVVEGIGVETLFPVYSPNIKEIKVLEKKRVRFAKLYYLRDKGKEKKGRHPIYEEEERARRYKR